MPQIDLPILLRHLLAVTFALGIVAQAAPAMPDPPGPATVYVARAERILVPQGLSAPRLLYPLGRVDYDVVERLVDSAAAAVAGTSDGSAWRRLFSATSRIGIMVDAGRYPVQLATVETVIDRLVNSGVPPSAIVVFASDEADQPAN